jgi:hypothetical protein
MAMDIELKKPRRSPSLKNSGQLQLFGRGAKKVGTSETGAGQFFF